MSSALLAALFAILGVGLAVTSTACLVLWRKVRVLTSTARAVGDASAAVSVSLPDRAAEPAKRPAKARYEVARRLDELAGRHRALEARLARVEASATEAAIAIVADSARPRPTRRVNPGGPTLISVPNLARAPAPPSEAAAELDRRFGGVWAMADSGAAIEAIARESGYPIGQVELILGLRRRLLAAEAGADV